MIHSLLDTTRVVGHLDVVGEPFEVCAEATASHDRSANGLTVNLCAFLRAMRHDHLGEKATADWLPAPEIVTEHVDIDEAHGLTDEIFASWCHRVAALIPSP
jgi:hypothetical protein